MQYDCYKGKLKSLVIKCLLYFLQIHIIKTQGTVWCDWKSCRSSDTYIPHTFSYIFIIFIKNLIIIYLQCHIHRILIYFFSKRKWKEEIFIHLSFFYQNINYNIFTVSHSPHSYRLNQKVNKGKKNHILPKA